MRGVDLDGAHIMFYMPMPRSWSEKKRKEHVGNPHRQKPDLDNLIKALGDALYGDDSSIASISAAKVWSSKAAIDITEKGHAG